MDERSPLRAVDAVTVPVPDLDAGLAFYADALGHEVMWRNDSVGQAGLRLPDGESELVLTTRHRYEPNWLVDSVETALERIAARGGTTIAGPDDIPVGKVGVVADPFGNHLVLVDLSKGAYPNRYSTTSTTATATTAAPAHASLAEQVQHLEAIVNTNPAVRAILAGAGDLDLPDWYLGAGALSQTVWNVQHGFDPQRWIKDYDLVYFDPDDLGAATEHKVEETVRRHFADLGVEIDVKNEARVHLWYHERFGVPIEPYQSSAHAVTTWPTTAASMGARCEHGRFVVFAPFGLSDLFAMIVRPNKTQVPRAVYEEKASRWASQWPGLTVVPW